MIYLEKNLSALSFKQPELAASLRNTTSGPHYQTLPAKSGQITLKAGGNALHSLYDPVKEAEKLAGAVNLSEGETVIIKGFGLGYLAEACIAKGLSVAAMEADLEILRLALENRDLTAVIEKTVFFTPANQESWDKFLLRNGIKTDAPQINHHPSIKLHPEFYQNTDYSSRGEPAVTMISESAVKFPMPRLSALQTGLKRRLKIFLPSPLYGGSLPVAGYCKRALEGLGHSVEYFDCTAYYPIYKSMDLITGNADHQAKLRTLFTMFVAQAALARAMEFKPDLVFGVAQSPFTRESLADFKTLGIPVAFWFVEDYQVLPYWRSYAPLYDFFLVIQRGEFAAELNRMGVNHYYLPMAAEPEAHKPVKLTAEEQREYGSALSFVGAGYPNRRVFFRGLIKEDFKLWGTEWDTANELKSVLQRDGARISTDDCVKIFNASEININLHSWMEPGGINPRGDFINPRTFEIAACGAFQLCDVRVELSNCFEIGREIAVFNSYDDFQRQKGYYLKNAEARREIAEAGRKRILKEHTYKHRMQEMLKIVMGIEAESPPIEAAPAVIIPPAGDNPNQAGNLLKAAGDDEELKAVFAAFPAEEVLNVDKVAEYILSKKTAMNETEGLFILMKEFSDWAKQKKVI